MEGLESGNQPWKSRIGIWKVSVMLKVQEEKAWDLGPALCVYLGGDGGWTRCQKTSRLTPGEREASGVLASFSGMQGEGLLLGTVCLCSSLLCCLQEEALHLPHRRSLIVFVE
jgi:hypothetical protein